MRSQITGKSLLILLLVFSATGLGMSWSFRVDGQPKNTQESAEAIRQKFKEQFPVVDSDEQESSDPQQRAIRSKRSKKHNERMAKIGPNLVQSSEGYNWPLDFKPLPTDSSDVVIVGKISDAKAHLSEDKNSVYSEFAVTIDEVLKNKTGVMLSPGATVTIERNGGRIRYPSGHISWFFVVGQGLPQLGGQYVLFLKTTDEERLFDVLTGYQILKGLAEPLDYSPGVVGFQRYSGSDADALIKEIRSNLAVVQP
ncbi:MAG: hypothetical protein QOG23_932 [Blastocatellia bacterium]|nr:hypothetical protein [Blastocatellia bacterium]